VFIARNGPDGRPAQPRALRATAAVVALLLAGVGTGTLYIFQSAGKVYALDGATFVGGMAASGGFVALLLAGFHRPRAALATVVVAFVALNWGFVIRVLPSFERYKPVPRLSMALRERLTEGDVVAHYNVALPSMVFYLGRHIDVFFEREPFLQRLRSGRTVYAILSASDYAALQPSIGVPTCVLDRQSTVNVKLKAVLSREPLPEVLLVTNRCR
jgi:hypothetical protein